MKQKDLSSIIEGCIQGRQSDFKAFYEHFYGYAMSICLAYSNNREDALELLNDGFLKVFKNLKNLQNQEAIRPWLRQIMVNSALDHYRKRKQQVVKMSADEMVEVIAEPTYNSEGVLAQISAEEIIALLQKLPPALRLVFGLYVLEGYSHQEIGKKLGIAESTSRAYLTDANKLLRKAWTLENEPEHERLKR